jgi:hypothetical protein
MDARLAVLLVMAFLAFPSRGLAILADQSTAHYHLPAPRTLSTPLPNLPRTSPYKHANFPSLVLRPERKSEASSGFLVFLSHGSYFTVPVNFNFTISRFYDMQYLVKMIGVVLPRWKTGRKAVEMAR